MTLLRKGVGVALALMLVTYEATHAAVLPSRTLTRTADNPPPPSDSPLPLNSGHHQETGPGDFFVDPHEQDVNKTGSDVKESEKDILEHNVHSLNAEDPRLKEEGGLQVLSAAGQPLTFSRTLDGQVSVNGELVDGVKNLEDGTQVYTLERFLQEHQGRLDEAFQFLSSQSRALDQKSSQSTGQDGFTAQPESTDKVSQVPRPSSEPAEEETPRYSVVVSEVTEISSETAPPPVTHISVSDSFQESLPEDPVTELGVFSDTNTETVTESISEPVPVTQFLFETLLKDQANPTEPISVVDDHIIDEIQEISNDSFPVTEAFGLFSEDNSISKTLLSNDASSTVDVSSSAVAKPTEDFDGTIYTTESLSQVSEQDTTVPPKEAEETLILPLQENLDDSKYQNSSVSTGNEATALTLEAGSNSTEAETPIENSTDLVPEAEILHEKSEDTIQETSTSVDIEVNSETSSSSTVEGSAGSTPLSLEANAPHLEMENTGPEDQNSPFTVVEEPLEPVSPVFRVPLTVPSIPQVVDETEASSLLDIWRHAIRNQDPQVTQANELVPTTVLSPDYLSVVNLVPQDAPHPLYSNKEENVALRTEILLDYLILERITSQDPRMTQPGGITVSNLAGHSIAFTADADGNIRVNDIPVESVETLSDGTQVYNLASLLFDHQARVSEAFSELNSQPSKFGPLGVPLIEEPIEGVSPVSGVQLTVPSIPQVVDETEASSLLNIWRHALRNQDLQLTRSNELVPATVLSPDYLSVVNLVPQDAPHPLYSNSDENVALRTEILLDYLILESVSPQDPRMTQLGGITVTNLVGHSIAFTADADGNIRVNDIPVESVETLSDGTQVYNLASLLFNHQARVSEAFSELNSQPSKFGPLGVPLIEEPVEPVTLVLGLPLSVPQIPQGVEEHGTSFLDLWNHALRNQDDAVSLANDLVPATVLSPDYLSVVNLVPQDSPHPLYSNRAENVALRTEILLDYLILEAISPQDPRVTQPGGITVTNLAGHSVTFTADTDGNIKVNDIPVESVETLSDGTQFYNLASLLFDHQARVSEAYVEPLHIEPLGGPIAEEGVDPVSGVQLTVPSIPQVVDENEASSLINIWRHAIRNQDLQVTRSNDLVPATVLSPDYLSVVNLAPQDAPHPLYIESEENVALRTELLLDYLILESVSPQDPRMTQPGGFTVTNLAGHTLTFAADAEGNIKVNDIPVEAVETLSDGTLVYNLASLLFDHQARVSQAFDALGPEEFKFDPWGIPFEPIEGVSPVPVVQLTVPSIPQVVEDTDSSSLLNIWRHALRNQDLQVTRSNELVPATVLSPDYLSVVNLVPQDAPHPLYSNSDENVALRTEILLDYLILESVSVQDPRMTQPGGISVTNLAGHTVTFSADTEGNIRVNDILVESVETLSDGTQVYSLASLLFDHQARVSDAFTSRNSRSSQSGPFEPLEGVNPVSRVPLIVPSIPKVVEETGSSSLINIWRQALWQQEKAQITRSNELVPATVLSPHPNMVSNLVPQDAPHPLYTDSEKNVALRAEILLDYLVLESVSPQDPRITQPGGFTVTNLAGHTLTFAADAEGNIRVNDIPVEAVETLSDGTLVYNLASLLFDHQARVKQAFDELGPGAFKFDPWGRPFGRSKELRPISGLPLIVPSIPKVVEETGSSSLINIWRQALWQQEKAQITRSNELVPATVLSPDYNMVSNLVPQDAPHPLYGESEKDVALRAEILLDYLVEESVSPQDPRMTQPGGFTVTNFAGHTLTFAADAEGNIRVNDIPVEAVETLSDGTMVYNLASLLFDHQARVSQAFDELGPGAFEFDPWGRHFEHSERVKPPVSGGPLTVPKIPKVVEDTDSSSLLNIWRHALRKQDAQLTEVDDRVPKTILSPEPHALVNLVPQDAPHPLYADGEENVALRTEFLLDYLVLEAVNKQDPRITQSEGLTVTNLAGNNLTFTSDAEGNLRINGIPVEATNTLVDGTEVYRISSLLFDHRARVQNLFSRSSEIGSIGVSPGENIKTFSF